MSYFVPLTPHDQSTKGRSMVSTLATSPPISRRIRAKARSDSTNTSQQLGRSLLPPEGLHPVCTTELGYVSKIKASSTSAASASSASRSTRPRPTRSGSRTSRDAEHDDELPRDRRPRPQVAMLYDMVQPERRQDRNRPLGIRHRPNKKIRLMMHPIRPPPAGTSTKS